MANLTGMFGQLNQALGDYGTSLVGAPSKLPIEQQNLMQRMGINNPLLQQFGQSLGTSLGKEMGSIDTQTKAAFKGANLGDPRSLMELAQRMESVDPVQAAKLRAEAVKLVQAEKERQAAAKQQEFDNYAKTQELLTKGIEIVADAQGRKIAYNKLTGEVRSFDDSLKGQVEELLGADGYKKKVLLNTETGEIIKDLGASEGEDKQVRIQESEGNFLVFRGTELINRYKDKGEADLAKASEDLTVKSLNVIDTIDKALEMLNDPASSVGSWNSIKEWIPMASQQRTLKSYAESVRANIGFDELRKLKEGGGTLGQVSNIENALLQSVIAQIDTANSKEAMREAFQKIKQSYKRILEAKAGNLPIQRYEDGSISYKISNNRVAVVDALGNISYETL